MRHLQRKGINFKNGALAVEIKGVENNECIIK